MRKETLAIATGRRGAKSSLSPASKPAAVIQYNRAGFSNQGLSSSRGVIQSPERAISRPIAAYRGSSGPSIPLRSRPRKYRKNRAMAETAAIVHVLKDNPQYRARLVSDSCALHPALVNEPNTQSEPVNDQHDGQSLAEMVDLLELLRHLELLRDDFVLPGCDVDDIVFLGREHLTIQGQSGDAQSEREPENH